MPNEMQQQWNTSWLDSGNQSYLDNLYEAYLKNPADVPKNWQDYFQKLIQANTQADVSHADIRDYFKKLSYQPKKIEINNTVAVSLELQQIAVEKLIFAYRLLGHLQSNINPIGMYAPEKVPELELEYYNLHKLDLNTKLNAADLAGPKQRTLGEILRDLKKIYCSTVATEYMHISDSAERDWVQRNLESTLLNLSLSKEEKLRILELVTAADGLEKYIAAKYPGSKRFSIEGCDSLIVALDKIIFGGGSQGIEEIVLAMAHRGRLNVLVNLLGKMPRELFEQFEDIHNEEVESGDVKYHQGFATDLRTPGGNVHVSLAFNPSHLEVVTAVATGSVRARQQRRNDERRNQVICVAMHGDAAFAGQGIVMEIMNMSCTRAYSVGGTIHIIVNNQIGFTTSNPQDARSTMYCSDIGKMLSIPIFHVNADDPEAVLAITNLALQYRLKFNKDVIIDLIGYRRMGHNEADEPSATQPLMYKTIRAHPTLKELYANKMISDQIFNDVEIKKLETNYREILDRRDQAVVKYLADNDWRSEFASDWTPYANKDWRVAADTTVNIETLKQLAIARDTIPDGFVLNPRVKKIIEDRRKMTSGELAADWGYAETLAYASLLNEGFAVRLTGQDSGRGTFFHRHAVLHEQNTGATYIPLQHISKKQGNFEIYDSLLSEEAVLGFEYGFSSSEPRALTLWEAQFGDFANGAQVIVDQFISSGEQKWGRLSGLVMLLPHGYEGQGPEHSSARLERYLQLCAQHNIQVCVPSTPAQMFHLLRRQLLRPIRKPLIIITPKSLLRHKEAVSSLQQIANAKFEVIMRDTTQDYSTVRRVIICAGKVYYDLIEIRHKIQQPVAIIRVEQLYPFPEVELQQELQKYSSATEIVWCQEEPRNQGSWYATQHHLLNCLNTTQQLQYAGRDASAAPAVGYYKLHLQQQEELLHKALGIEI
jgi:2-oxoglutarate dehydrogenase E1 component